MTEEQTYLRDSEHLRSLSIFSYVVGGITALCGSFPLIYVFLGMMMMINPEGMNGQGQESSEAGLVVGGLFALFGLAVALFAWLLGAGTVYAGRCLSRREAHTFCLVVSGFNCLNMPLGTVYGVFMIIVLTRPSVKQLFGKVAAAPA